MIRVRTLFVLFVPTSCLRLAKLEAQGAWPPDGIRPQGDACGILNLMPEGILEFKQRFGNCSHVFLTTAIFSRTLRKGGGVKPKELNVEPYLGPAGCGVLIASQNLANTTYLQGFHGGWSTVYVKPPSTSNEAQRLESMFKVLAPNLFYWSTHVSYSNLKYPALFQKDNFASLAEECSDTDTEIATLAHDERLDGPWMDELNVHGVLQDVVKDAHRIEKKHGPYHGVPAELPGKKVRVIDAPCMHWKVSPKTRRLSCEWMEDVKTSMRGQLSFNMAARRSASSSALNGTPSQHVTGCVHVCDRIAYFSSADFESKLPAALLASTPTKPKGGLIKYRMLLDHHEPATTDQRMSASAADSGRKEIIIAAVSAVIVAGVWVFQKPLEESVMVGLPHAVSWLVCTSAMVVFNKWIFEDGKGDFPFVITLTLWHSILCTVVTSILRWCAPCEFAESWMPAFAGNARFQLGMKQWVTGAVPLGVLFSGSILLGNLSYMLCTISFLQMMKAGLGPLVACAFAIFMGSEPFSASLIQIMTCIAVSDVIMFYSGATQIPVGAIVQLGCMLCEMMRLQLLQVFLHSSGNNGVKLDPISAIYLFSPIAMVINVVAAGVLEWQQDPILIMEKFLNVGLIVWLANGMVALTLNFLSVVCVSKVGALSFVVVGISKDAFLLACDAIIFGTKATLNMYIGFVLCAGGVFLYTLYKAERDKFIQLGVIGGLRSALDK